MKILNLFNVLLNFNYLISFSYSYNRINMFDVCIIIIKLLACLKQYHNYRAFRGKMQESMDLYPLL